MKAAKRVNFQDILKLETLTDEEHIVLVYLNSRVMRLLLKDSLPFLLAVQQNMKVSFLFILFVCFLFVFFSVCGCSHTPPPPLDYPSAKFKAEGLFEYTYSGSWLHKDWALESDWDNGHSRKIDFYDYQIAVTDYYHFSTVASCDLLYNLTC
jgi:hypothetical protein